MGHFIAITWLSALQIPNPNKSLRTNSRPHSHPSDRVISALWPFVITSAWIIIARQRISLHEKSKSKAKLKRNKDDASWRRKLNGGISLYYNHIPLLSMNANTEKIYSTSPIQVVDSVIIALDTLNRGNKYPINILFASLRSEKKIKFNSSIKDFN